MASWEAVQTGRRLKELEDRLKDADRPGGKALRRLRQDIRRTAKPVEAQLKTAVMGVRWTRGNDPYARRTREGGAPPRRSTRRHGPRTTALRLRTARAIGTSVTRRGIRIRVSERKFGSYGKAMPRYMDGELRNYRRLRHPVFGDPDTWVEFHGKRWFFQTIRRNERRFDRAVNQTMDRVMVEITR